VLKSDDERRKYRYFLLVAFAVNWQLVEESQWQVPTRGATAGGSARGRVVSEMRQWNKTWKPQGEHGLGGSEWFGACGLRGTQALQGGPSRSRRLVQRTPWQVASLGASGRGRRQTPKKRGLATQGNDDNSHAAQFWYSGGLIIE